MKISILIFLALSMGIMSPILSCHGKNPKPAMISVSILPQKYFAEKITGGKYTIAVMVPPGHNPETFEPGYAQMKAVSASFLYFRIGLIPFEIGQMHKIASINPSMKIIDTSEGVNLIISEEYSRQGPEGLHHEHAAGADPHIWLSPKEVKVIAQNMLKALTEKFPENAPVFKQGFLALMADIDAADKKLYETLKPLQGRSFICFHPAWTYLARDYGLKQISIEHEGKEPSPAHIKSLVDIAKKEHIKAVVLEEQFPSALARSFAKDIDGKIVKVNPLEQDWPAMMNNISSALFSAISEKER